MISVGGLKQAEKIKQYFDRYCNQQRNCFDINFSPQNVSSKTNFFSIFQFLLSFFHVSFLPQIYIEAHQP